MVVTSKTVAQELEHITKEMYKKNLELAQRNKILLMLRKIEELILSTVVDIDIIGREVSKIIVEGAGFNLCGLYLVNHNRTSLNPLAITFSQSNTDLQKKCLKLLSTEKISLLRGDNLLKKAVKNRKIQKSKDLESLPCQGISKSDSLAILKSLEIDDLFVYPLIISQRVIGTMAVGIGVDGNFNYEQQKELLDSLPDIVSIALDNSMLYQTIENANSRLKELDTLKDEFVSVASHELRTPMTAIKSYLWMALNGQGGPLSQKQKFYLERSYESTDRLIKLVNDMLNISRIESGRMSIELNNVNLAKISQEVIDEIAPRAKELGIKVTIMAPSKLPEVIADADKIKEVIINLIGNSFKFTPKEGSITFNFQIKKEFVITQIADTGAGLTPDMIGNLFQKFGLIKGSYQTNKTSVNQGTGLGLYICKQIIELHHGDISATSAGLNQGSVFSFSLPISSPTKLKLYQHQFQHSSNIGIIHSKI